MGRLGSVRSGRCWGRDVLVDQDDPIAEREVVGRVVVEPPPAEVRDPIAVLFAEPALVCADDAAVAHHQELLASELGDQPAERGLGAIE